MEAENVQVRHTIAAKAWSQNQRAVESRQAAGIGGIYGERQARGRPQEALARGAAAGGEGVRGVVVAEEAEKVPGEKPGSLHLCNHPQNREQELQTERPAEFLPLLPPTE